MKTQVQSKNQQAINDFFEAFGVDTAKEYSTSIFDLTVMVAAQVDIPSQYKEDLLTKLKDLNRLVLQLEKTEKVCSPVFEGTEQRN